MADEVQGREHLVRRQQALTNVFKRFQPHWRVVFAPSQWPMLLGPWLEVLEGIDTDLLEQAARELLKTERTYPPKAWDLARAARALRTGQRDGVPGPGSAVRARVWQWQSAITGRLTRAERRDDGDWIWHAIDDAMMFAELDDAARVEYCETMALAYRQRVASGQVPNLLGGAA